MTLYFYDLETSGTNPREQRIMQFAGQRTNALLEPIGEVDNHLIKLSDDVLPDPYAILTHGITPQQANAEGITEAEFLKWFYDEVATPETVFVGYNSVRFDDEFMRYLNYRNFYDPYVWHWQNNRSRWDIMDVARMTRALRPDGIEWPFASNGKPTVRLESLTSVNKISHSAAHTADSDVQATIEVAKLIRQNQPKLFDYLLDMRSKTAVTKFIKENDVFVYTSGRYSSQYEKTTLVHSIGEHPEIQGSVLVYDLRVDPAEFEDMTVKELSSRIYLKRDSKLTRLPVKAMALNKCPAVAPPGVLDAKAWKRIKLDQNTVNTNLKKLLESKELVAKLIEVFSAKKKADQAKFLVNDDNVDAQLYDGFIGDTDTAQFPQIHNCDESTIDSVAVDFKDDRLKAMLPLYIARNYPGSLNSKKKEAWELFRANKFSANNNERLKAFSDQFDSAYQNADEPQEQYLLEELKLYVESILPASD